MSSTNKNAQFIFGVYNKIILNERFYTLQQAKIRRLAAYWLLIVFSAIGLVFSSKEAGLPFEHLLSVIIICIIGICGNAFIWYEDLVIQERFLNLNHLEAFRLENLYSWLPKIHHHHVVFTHKAMLKLKVIFYVGCNSILLVILNITLFIYLSRFVLIIMMSSVAINLVVFIFLSRFMFMQTYKNELSSLRNLTHD